MRKILTAIILLATIAVTARQKYVATTGSDAGSGDITAPWATLYKVSTTAIAGDTVNIASGSYSESHLCQFATGISLLGAGKTVTTIHCLYPTDKTLYFNSAALTAGNHEIAGITFDGGNLTGYQGLGFRYRTNVKVHDCHFVDFSFRSVSFTNGSGFQNVRPAIYAANNELYNCTFVNAGATWATSGSFIYITGQIGFKLHHCSGNPTSRAGNPPPIVVKSSELKALDMHDNDFKTQNNDDNANWAFIFECWDLSDGCRIYNNNFEGVLDLVNVWKDNSTYGIEVYGNDFGYDTYQNVAKQGIYLEGHCDGIAIHDNVFKNLSNSFIIYTLAGNTFNNIHVFKNSFNGVGFNGSVGYDMAMSVAGPGGFFIDGYYIENNTFATGQGINNLGAITLPTKGTTKHVYIRNNIISDFGYNVTTSYLPSGGGGTVDSLYIQNNDIYNNKYPDPVWISGVTPTHLVRTGNITTNPLFVSTADLHLQAISSAIDNGLDIGLPYYGLAPDMGAYEFYVLPGVKPVAKYGGKIGRYNNQIGKY